MVSQLQALATLTAAWGVYATWDGSFFAYHPALMLVALLVCHANALSFARGGAGGRSLAAHRLLASLGACMMVAGVWVIYENKEAHGKPHWWTWSSTWHAFLGGLVAASFALQALGASATMHQWSTRAERRPFVGGHVAFGRLLTAVALFVICLGWFEMRSLSLPAHAAFAAAVAAVAWGLLTQRGWKLFGSQPLL